jgi:non-ribosomal peptide synthetase component F
MTAKLEVEYLGIDHKTNDYRYLGKPEATAAAFTPDGWYKSGDIARKEGDYFFILGRESIDSKFRH